MKELKEEMKITKIFPGLSSRRLICLLSIFLAFSVSFPPLVEAADSGSKFTVTADLVSSYVWRGSLSTQNPVPNIQPTISFSTGKLEAGVWGSTDFAGSYKEVDPYLIITKGLLKIVLTDYNWNFTRSNYFNYGRDQTGHRVEGTIGYTGSKSFPINITCSTIVYGYDKRADDSTRQAWSTYAELGYSKGAAAFFLGFTPWASYYNNYGTTVFDAEATRKSFSVVNIGASISKGLKITESYSLPVKVALIVNPSATYSRNDYIHLTVGITI